MLSRILTSSVLCLVATLMPRGHAGDDLPSRIALGSCAHQNREIRIFRNVVKQRPDLFIFLGDNIYGDTRDMNVLREKYGLLAGQASFQLLRREVPILATWDDHDYGENDAGKGYPMKAESREIFLDFWGMPADSPRRQHAGIYDVQRYEKAGKVLQIILLDTRTFRDDFKTAPPARAAGDPRTRIYVPDPDPDKTLLGAAQWAWLAARLKEPADLRVICSSIQFSHAHNGCESWTNLPTERQRMVDLIRETGARGVFFLSGDVHYGEISCYKPVGSYPLYDLTASGLVETQEAIGTNANRVGKPLRSPHFGMLEIDWDAEDPTIELQLRDYPGRVRTRLSIRLSELAMPAE